MSVARFPGLERALERIPMLLGDPCVLGWCVLLASGWGLRAAWARFVLLPRARRAFFWGGAGSLAVLAPDGLSPEQESLLRRMRPGSHPPIARAVRRARDPRPKDIVLRIVPGMPREEDLQGGAILFDASRGASADSLPREWRLFVELAEARLAAAVRAAGAGVPCLLVQRTRTFRDGWLFCVFGSTPEAGRRAAERLAGQWRDFHAESGSDDFARTWRWARGRAIPIAVGTVQSAGA